MMRIDLGRHTTHKGLVVHAWIEPNFPSWRAGAIRDHGFLCLKQAQDVSVGEQSLSLRLESTSEDQWKLSCAVGNELGGALWNERKSYDRRPFFLVYDHAQIGRLYAEPQVQNGTCVGMAVCTRPSSAATAQALELGAADVNEHLQALFTQEALQRHLPNLPNTEDITIAMQSAQATAARVADALTDFTAVVDWNFGKRFAAVMFAGTGRMPLTDDASLLRYEAVGAFAIRPTDQFADEIEVYHRWYDSGGAPRPEPLTTEQLSEYLLTKQRYTAEHAKNMAEKYSVPAAEWEWFKNQRLGRMRNPIELLHRIICQERLSEVPDAAWLRTANVVVDFCTPIAATPMNVYSHLAAYVATHENKLGVLRHEASAVLQYMADPANGLAILPSDPVAKTLEVAGTLATQAARRAHAIAEGSEYTFGQHADDLQAGIDAYHQLTQDISRIPQNRTLLQVECDDFQPTP